MYIRNSCVLSSVILQEVPTKCTVRNIFTDWRSSTFQQSAFIRDQI